MAPSGTLPGARRALLLCALLACLLLPGIRGQAFSLWVEPQGPLVISGGSLLVNCSTDCPSAPLIHLETPLVKEPQGRGPNWVAFQLHNVTDDSQVLCGVVCQGSQMTSSTNLTVYRLPERVELVSLPPWQPVGETLTLRCVVAGGAPRQHLSVALLRGEEELSRQPAVGEPAEVTATVLARREDHGANFSCRAELDLRPQGLGLFRNTSAPRQLRTFALPVTPPRLDVPRFLEVGMSRAVSCTLDGLFPASEAQVRLALGDQELNPEVVSQRDTLKATATATARADQEGAGEMACIVRLGGESRKIQQNVTVHGFLGPNLTLSESSVLEGTMVTVTCASGARALVTLDGTPAAGSGQPAQLHLNATEHDDGRGFFCTATLQVDGETLRRSASAELRVLYGPKIDRAKCAERFTWKEKTYQVLRCQARGNPAPRLQCLHEVSSASVPVGTQFHVTLNYSGTYRCQAASSRGTDTLEVVLVVQNRNPRSVVVVLAVLSVLGLVILAVALMCVFKRHKRSGSYRPWNTFLPLTSREPDGAGEEEPS
ncbi:intercellular adhesion molecule 3 [Choloepus didactylus]|uniref:intercellular adhesion molecule 3 n=1 Tax=Choloepus didactylus TaxID=27675 RepID=UPI0018A0E3C7|nr:intercellular adhesion molecule 3 [Choloepus didactylus]XP_037674415.1 intercellular adhesion molecule 3 [Choloepus didactylus]XP_037674416.1 intercellular adhesion molecule 3 [Choloepus didactylus]XP_037674417.1 intercellular adhesion molecule 3 [Choloepus didactylus]